MKIKWWKADNFLQNRPLPQILCPDDIDSSLYIVHTYSRTYYVYICVFKHHSNLSPQNPPSQLHLSPSSLKPLLTSPQNSPSQLHHHSILSQTSPSQLHHLSILSQPLFPSAMEHAIWNRISHMEQQFYCPVCKHGNQPNNQRNVYGMDGHWTMYVSLLLPIRVWYNLQIRMLGD